jgi:putative phosphoribosyl transferase
VDVSARARSARTAHEGRFKNRVEAGRLLAEALRAYAGRGDVLVLALPRGGVPVGLEIARELHVPLDVFLVRKLGLPGQEELAMGAIATGGARVLNEELVSTLGLDQDLIDAVATRERAELERRERLYRGDRPPPDVRGKVAVLVDDGLATGSSMRAAVAALREQGPARIVVAVPAAPRQTCDGLRRHVDELVVLKTPQPFYAVGFWYEDFSEVSDEDVRRLLGSGRGIVIFAHGSGSSGQSPRSRAVADVLEAVGLETVLFDLLQPGEEDRRFDIPLLAERLLEAIGQAEPRGRPVGLFGASTGAAAALVAAAERPDTVTAVVSRGGRPDLAGEALAQVRCPTLLVVGEADETVLRLNREAMTAMQAPVELQIVPRATHLFEEPGALERVAELARDWFVEYLPTRAGAAAGPRAPEPRR